MDLKEQLEWSDRKGRKRKRKKKLPRAQYPKAIEQDYVRFLGSIGDLVREVYAPIFESLRAQLPDTKTDTIHVDALPLTARVGWRVDVSMEDLEDLLDKAAAKLRGALNIKRFKDFLTRHARRISDWSNAQFTKQARAAIGVDPLSSDAGLRKRAEGFVGENVTLIKKLASDTTARINSTVMRNVSEGSTYRTLADQITKDLDGDTKRATLVARDQTGKLYGQINADRQKGLGITKFIWRTSNDERVREEHAALEGEEFSYDNPPDEGLPGEPIQCRCYAEPVFDFLEPDPQPEK